MTTTEPRWCRKIRHILPEHQLSGKCRPCETQNNYRTIARRDGLPFCDAGHGLVRGNIGDDGTCNECARYEQICLDHIRPVDPVWLDWAAVAQALQGKPLVRPLSQREIICLVTTVKARHGWSRKVICAWLNENTHVTGLDEVYIQHLEQMWWRKRGCPDPRITLEQAIFQEVDGDDWANNHTQAREATVWEQSYRKRVRFYDLDLSAAVIADGNQRVTRQALGELYGHECWYELTQACTGKFVGIGYVVPIRDSGDHTLDNIRPSCRSCASARALRARKKDDAA